MGSLAIVARVLAACLLLATLGGCPDRGGPPARPLDKESALDPGREGPDTLRRAMECLQKDLDGECVAVKCTAGPGGATFDCGSYAKACLDAGLHWSGTVQGGTCTVPL